MEKLAINGGPKNIPAIEYVPTIEMAIPGEYFFEVPASINAIGNTAALPKPTKQNPIIAVQNCGKNTAIEIPSTINNELSTNVLGIPMVSSSLSKKNLDNAIQLTNVKYP